MSTPLETALNSIQNQPPAQNQEGTPPPAGKADSGDGRPSSIAALARTKALGEPEPPKNDPPVQDEPEEPSFSNLPKHDAFRGLVKPDKSAPHREHVAYMKKVGVAYAAYAKALEEEKGTIGTRLSEGEKALEEERKRATEFEKQLSRLPELEKEAGTLQQRLAMFDIQHDPTFQRKFVAPIREREKSLGDVLNVAGPQKSALFVALDAAMQKPDSEFYAAALDAMQGIIPEAMQPVAIGDLRELRSLYAQRNKALEAQPDVKELLSKERTKERIAAAESWLSGDYRRMEDEMTQKSGAFRVLMQEPAVAELIKPHEGVLKEIDESFPRAMRAAAEKYGELPSDVVSFALLGKQLLPSLFMTSEMLRSYRSAQERIEELEEALRIEKQRASGGRLPAGDGGREEGPSSMRDLVRAKVNEA